MQDKPSQPGQTGQAGDPEAGIVREQVGLKAELVSVATGEVVWSAEAFFDCAEEATLEAIREKRFYVLAEDDWKRACDLRCEDVRLARNPTFVVPGAGR